MKKLKLSVTEDEAYLGGYALIRFPQECGDEPKLRLAITRKSSDTPHLGKSGWQAGRHVIEAETVMSGKGSTTVRVGPDVCEEIREDVQVTIEAVDHGIGGDCFWPHVAARMDGGRRSPEEAQPPKQPEAEAAPSPPAQPTRPQLAPQAPPEKPARSGRLPLYLLLLALVVAAGGGFYAFKDRIAWDGLFGESLAAKFERLKQTDNDGDELLALSVEADAAHEAGISLQALRLAFERGNTDAKIALARLYDPRFADPAKLGSPEAPDANLAARYYFEMCVASHAEATQLLGSLCEESRKADSPHSSRFEGFLANTYCEGNCGQ